MTTRTKQMPHDGGSDTDDGDDDKVGGRALRPVSADEIPRLLRGYLHYGPVALSFGEATRNRLQIVAWGPWCGLGMRRPNCA